jgi:hypothetical protein
VGALSTFNEYSNSLVATILIFASSEPNIEIGLFFPNISVIYKDNIGYSLSKVPFSIVESPNS